jgi:4-amino-4-deoxy-L-arabinose transferase-like glycosyltransferase
LSTLSRENLFFIFILLAGAYLRLVNLATFQPVVSDEGIYYQAAYVISRGYVPYKEIFLPSPPLYFITLGAVFRAIDTNVLIARGFNASLGVLTIFLIFYYSSKFFGKSAGLLASMIYSFYPEVIYSNKVGFIENYESVWVFLTICFYFVLKTNKKHKDALLLGSIAVLGFLTKYTSIFFIIPFFIFAAIDFYKNARKEFLKSMFYVFLGCLIVGLTTLVTIYVLGAFEHFYFDTFFLSVNRIMPVQPSTKHLFFNDYVSRSGLLFLLWIVVLILSMPLFIKRDSSVLVVNLSLATSFLLLYYLTPFIPHYPYFLYPVLIISLTACLREVYLFIFKRKEAVGTKLARIETTVIMTLLVSSCYGVAYQLNPNITVTPYKISQDIFFNQIGLTYDEQMKIARGIQVYSNSSDKIFTTAAEYGFLARREIASSDRVYCAQGFFSDVFSYEYDRYREDGKILFTPADVLYTLKKEQPKVILYIGWFPFATGVDKLLWYGFTAHGQYYEGIASYVEGEYRLAERYHTSWGEALLYVRKK